MLSARSLGRLGASRISTSRSLTISLTVVPRSSAAPVIALLSGIILCAAARDFSPRGLGALGRVPAWAGDGYSVSFRAAAAFTFGNGMISSCRGFASGDSLTRSFNGISVSRISVLRSLPGGCFSCILSLACTPFSRALNFLLWHRPAEYQRPAL